MNAPRKNLSFDPAWIALGVAAAVLIGAVAWLMAARDPTREAATPRRAVSGATTPAANPAAPDPLDGRLAALERDVAALASRPAAEPELAARVQALVAREQQTEQSLAELRAATGAVLREAGESVAQRFAQLDGGIRAALTAAEARLQQQEQVLAQLPSAIAALERGINETREGTQRLLSESRAETDRVLEAARTEGRERTETASRETRERLEAMAEEARRRAEEAQGAAESAAGETREAIERAVRDTREAQERAAAEAVRRAEEFARQITEAGEASSRRLAALEDRLRSAETRSTRVAATAGLRGLLDAGRPLGPELDRLGGEAPAELGRFRERAPPTESQLRAAFEERVREMRASVTATDALQRLGSVLTIRRGEDVLLGDAAESGIERARRALEAGEIAGALGEVRALPARAREALRPWTEEAEAVLAARTTLRRLGEG